MERIVTLFRKTKQFLLVDMWAREIKTKSRLATFGFRVLRVTFLTLKGFVEDKISLRATSLAIITLLSLPLALALGFSVAKGFGLQDQVRTAIFKHLGLEQDTEEPTGSEATATTDAASEQAAAAVQHVRTQLAEIVKNVESPMPAESRDERLRAVGASLREVMAQIAEVAPPRPVRADPAAADDGKMLMLRIIHGQIASVAGHVDTTLATGDTAQTRQVVRLQLKSIVGYIDNSSVSAADAIRKPLESMLGYVDRTDVSGMGWVATLIIFYAVLKVLSSVETAFNQVWGIRQGRTLVRKFTDYISIVVVCPILMIVATSITATITSEAGLKGLENYFQTRAVPETGDGAVVEEEGNGAMNVVNAAGLAAVRTTRRLIGMGLAFLVMVVAFSFLYLFMPNTKVRWLSAFVGGVIAAILWQLIQWAFFKFQIGVAKYNVIYGAMFSIPVFIVWLVLSWQVVLFGAEVSFAHQNEKTYEREGMSLTVSEDFRENLALRILASVGERFDTGENARSSPEIADELSMPLRLVNDLLFELSQCRFVTEIPGTERTYQPAMPLDRIRVKDVIDRLRHHGHGHLEMVSDPPQKYLHELLAGASSAEADALDGRTIRDVIEAVKRNPSQA